MLDTLKFLGTGSKAECFLNFFDCVEYISERVKLNRTGLKTLSVVFRT